MPNYRRAWQPGGTWFFTVALLERHNNTLLVQYVDTLREAIAHTKTEHPYAKTGSGLAFCLRAQNPANP